MSDARFQVLLAEIRADRAALEAHRARLDAALPDVGRDDGAEAITAQAIHHYYTALESLFERIARAFEGVPASGERWHRDLLHAMSLDIEGIRPAVIRAEELADLNDLLGFRHVFRHAYAVSFDTERLRRVAERLIDVHPRLADDLDAFEAVLRAADQPG